MCVCVCVCVERLRRLIHLIRLSTGQRFHLRQMHQWSHPVYIAVPPPRCYVNRFAISNFYLAGVVFYHFFKRFDIHILNCRISLKISDHSFSTLQRTTYASYPCISFVIQRTVWNLCNFVQKLPDIFFRPVNYRIYGCSFLLVTGLNQSSGVFVIIEKDQPPPDC